MVLNMSDSLSILGQMIIYLFSDWVVLLGLAFFLVQTLGYVLLVTALAWTRSGKKLSVERENVVPLKELPRFTIIIPAYNEEKNIEKKLTNAYSLKYPQYLLEVIVVDDGSTDETPTILEELKRTRFPSLKVLRQKRTGKSSAQNLGLKDSVGEIVVISDADTFLNPEALFYAASDFMDPSVGGVTCKVQSVNGYEVTNLNQKIAFFIKKKENVIGSVLGMSGPFTAFRRPLIDRFDPSVYACDMDVALLVRKAGFRVVCDDRIVGYLKPHGRDYKSVVRSIKHTFKGDICMFLRHHDLLFTRRHGLSGSVMALQYLLLPLIAPLVFVFMMFYVVWKVLMGPFWSVFFAVAIFLLAFYLLMRKVARGSVVLQFLDLVFLRVVTYLTCFYVYFEYLKDRSGVWDTR